MQSRQSAGIPIFLSRVPRGRSFCAPQRFNDGLTAEDAREAALTLAQDLAERHPTPWLTMTEMIARDTLWQKRLAALAGRD